MITVVKISVVLDNILEASRRQRAQAILRNFDYVGASNDVISGNDSSAEAFLEEMGKKSW